MASSAASSPQCSVVLALAHLLHQHSLSYDDEKNALLDASVRQATEMANREGNAAGEEVHVVLTGSPRPTFAETNAWLLEGQPGSPAKPPAKPPATPGRGAPATPGRGGGAGNNDGTGAAEDDMSVDEEEDGNGERKASGAQLLQEYIAECTHGSTRNANMDDLGGSPTRLGGSVLDRYRERTQSADGMANLESHLDNDNKEAMEDGEAQNEIDESEHSKGPMVGQAVVNAVSQQKGVGLVSTARCGISDGGPTGNVSSASSLINADWKALRMWGLPDLTSVRAAAGEPMPPEGAPAPPRIWERRDCACRRRPISRPI